MMDLPGLKRAHSSTLDAVQKRYKVAPEINIQTITVSLDNFRNVFKEKYSLKRSPEFYVSYDPATATLIKYTPFN